MEYKTFKFNVESIEEVKSCSDSKTGLIRGYASTFGNVDLGNDVVERGAFLKCIDKYQKSNDKIPMCFQHSLMHIVGGFDPAKMREDDKGLCVEGEIYKKTSMGNDVYELAKQGVLNKMSIGYGVKEEDYDEYENGKMIRRIKEVDLYEISMVAHPMNPEARVTDMKMDKAGSSVSVDEFISLISNRDISLSEKKGLVSQILRKNVLSNGAAEFIMSFIFKDEKSKKAQEKFGNKVAEAPDIDTKTIVVFKEILNKCKQKDVEKELLLATNELKKLIK